MIFPNDATMDDYRADPYWQSAPGRDRWDRRSADYVARVDRLDRWMQARRDGIKPWTTFKPGALNTRAYAMVLGVSEVDLRRYKWHPYVDRVTVQLWNWRKFEVDGREFYRKRRELGLA